MPDPADPRRLPQGAGAETGAHDSNAGDAQQDEELLPNGDRASARAGRMVPEDAHLGWGDEGENYPSADGPPVTSPPSPKPTGGGGK